MSWLHLHGKRETEDGEVEEYEEDVEVTGPIRVQGAFASGFQSYELDLNGVYLVEITDQAPVAEEPAAAPAKKTKSES